MNMFATKTITKLKKNRFKKTILLLFQDDKKEYRSLFCTFPLKNRCFLIIPPHKNSLAGF